MELNRDQIVKALSMFIEDMPADLHLGFTRTVMFRELLQDTLALIRELAEENERLIAESAKEFTCAFGQPHSVSDCPITEEVAKAKADTVRKMQERFNQVFGGMDATNALLRRTFDQIAKELLEGKDEKQHT